MRSTHIGVDASARSVMSSKWSICAEARALGGAPGAPARSPAASSARPRAAPGSHERQRRPRGRGRTPAGHPPIGGPGWRVKREAAAQPPAAIAWAVRWARAMPVHIGFTEGHCGKIPVSAM